MEQPCAIQNTEALARLTHRFDVAIMADEALTGPDSAYRIAKNHGADVFAVKIEQSGWSGVKDGRPSRCILL
ncbi:enolase C-terminal domain-like protein [Klebsiella pneumoniae]